MIESLIGSQVTVNAQEKELAANCRSLCQGIKRRNGKQISIDCQSSSLCTWLSIKRGLNTDYVRLRANVRAA